MDYRLQAVTGVVAPQTGEAKIRECWPSVASAPAIAGMGMMLTRTIILAPLAWIIMAGVYFGKLGPFIAKRYTLTNRRVMIRRGWKGTPHQEIPLEQIDDVRVVHDSNSAFFRAGTLEILRGDQVVVTLPGTPEAEAFKIAILNARNAWVPGKVKTLPFIAASAAK
jgi:PH (Pleckstrin Homology) domain-containing protein